jgi:hypothetical protein
MCELSDSELEEMEKRRLYEAEKRQQERRARPEIYFVVTVLENGVLVDRAVDQPIYALERRMVAVMGQYDYMRDNVLDVIRKMVEATGSQFEPQPAPKPAPQPAGKEE